MRAASSRRPSCQGRRSRRSWIDQAHTRARARTCCRRGRRRGLDRGHVRGRDPLGENRPRARRRRHVRDQRPDRARAPPRESNRALSRRHGLLLAPERAHRLDQRMGVQRRFRGRGARVGSVHRTRPRVPDRSATRPARGGDSCRRRPSPHDDLPPGPSVRCEPRSREVRGLPRERDRRRGSTWPRRHLQRPGDARRPRADRFSSSRCSYTTGDERARPTAASCGRSSRRVRPRF